MTHFTMDRRSFLGLAAAGAAASIAARSANSQLQAAEKAVQEHLDESKHREMMTRFVTELEQAPEG